MKYDKEFHRWHLELKDTEIFGNIADDYGSVELAERALKSQSRTVHLWIYNRVPLHNKDFIEFVLAKHSQFKPVIKEALLCQLEYDLKAGGNEINKQAGVNFQSGSAISRVVQVERQVSIETQQTLETSTSDINLFYMGDFGVRLGKEKYERFDF